MPKAVRQALLDILVTEGGEDGDGRGRKWTIDDAEKYLAEMEKARRYLQETW